MTEEIRALLREAFASGYAAALDAGCDASADDAREQCEEFLAIIERRPA